MTTALPYQTAKNGAGALAETHKILSKFGCESFGTMIDAERGVTMVQFRWRGRIVALEASWRGYAAAYMRHNPSRGRIPVAERDRRAIEQAKLSVCSALRDWVKGQITAIECGVMSFEAAFMPHMLLASGERVIDRVQRDVLPAIEAPVA